MNEVRRYTIMSSMGIVAREGLNTVVLGHGTDLVFASDYDALAARVQELERERDQALAIKNAQLAAMTAERDRAVETMVAFVADKGPISGWWGRACAWLVEQRKEVEEQLAASQARVRELEQPRLTLAECVVVDYLEKEVDQLLPMLGVEAALITDLSHVGDFPDDRLGAEKYVWQAAIDFLRTQIATLQATLAERERRIQQLEDQLTEKTQWLIDISQAVTWKDSTTLAQAVVTVVKALEVQRDAAVQQVARLREIVRDLIDRVDVDNLTTQTVVRAAEQALRETGA